MCAVQINFTRISTGSALCENFIIWAYLKCRCVRIYFKISTLLGRQEKDCRTAADDLTSHNLQEAVVTTFSVWLVVVRWLTEHRLPVMRSSYHFLAAPAVVTRSARMSVAMFHVRLPRETCVTCSLAE